ncbi:MAG: peptide ABC transporter substrate-binding protein [Proteobacteria bacterium]|nr:peptide ABC transporter substrate-binding protein [Pseudomonadota bacterium]
MKHCIPWAMALVCVLCCALATASPREDTLERGNGPEPSTLDAQRCQEVACENVLRDLYEGLVAEGPDGAVIPGMAQRWEASSDGRTWTFHLRDGLTWSNGQTLDAPQIVASFRRAFAPMTAAPFAQSLFAIRDAEGVQAGKLPDTALGIEAPDARTVVFHLDRPVPLPQLLLLPIAYPVYLPAVQRWGAQHTRPGHLVSNGAYALADWLPQASITLVRNPHYRQRAPIGRVRYLVTEDAGSELQRYQAGDLDLTETLPPQPLAGLRARFGAQLRIAPYLGAFWFGFNVTKPPLGPGGRSGSCPTSTLPGIGVTVPGNRDVAAATRARTSVSSEWASACARALALRQALSLAIDREKLTTYLTGFGEQPAFRIVPPLPGYTPPSIPAAHWTQPQREAEAQRLFRAAGYTRADPPTLELRFNTSVLHRRLALAVAAMWRETLGVRVELRNEEWKAFVLNRRQRVITQVFRGGWIADVADPRDFLAAFTSDGPLNWTGWRDAGFDALLARADAATDDAQRNALLAQAEARLLAAQPLVPLYFYTSKHLVKPWVAGFTANPLDHHASRFLSWQKASR